MTNYIALLRAINLGAHNRIAMADLKKMLATIGCVDPKTLLLSGNAVFKSKSSSIPKIEQLLETASTKHLKVTTDYFVRSSSEWQDVIKANPFPKEAKKDPARMVMMCLREAPSSTQLKALRAAIKGPEIVEIDGRHAYFVYPHGQGHSKLTIAVIEKALGTRGTARNWNTVLKLGDLAQ